jgi:hypothetical protein
MVFRQARLLKRLGTFGAFPETGGLVANRTLPTRSFPFFKLKRIPAPLAVPKERLGAVFHGISLEHAAKPLS